MPLEYDLRGVPCPLTWARARVRLEGLARGTALVVLTDDARSARDLPRAAEATGFAVADVARVGDHWRITIEA